MKKRPMLRGVNDRLRSLIERTRRWLGRIVNAEIKQFAYNFQTLDAWGEPEVFQIELTNHCPMTCVMCPRTADMTRPLGYMDLELFQNLIREIAPSSKRIFLHHFGDSLVHPRLGEFIGFAEGHGVDTYLSANPTLLTEQRIHDLVDNGLRELVLSLDGATAETSATVRGPAARNVELAERRVRSLLDYRRERGTDRPRVIMQFVRSALNQHEAEAWLAKWAAVEGLDAVKIKSYIGWDGANAAINALRIYEAPEATDLVCEKPWTSVTVLWDGRVVPCCFDHDGSYILGNVGDQTLREIFAGDAMRELRRAHRDCDLGDVALCKDCVDKAGFPVKRWTYPLNRLFSYRDPVGGEDRL